MRWGFRPEAELGRVLIKMQLLKTRKISVALLSMTLYGCAGGAILAEKPADVSKVAHLEVLADDENFWIWPIHGDIETEQRIKAPGVWVTDGWFMIEDQCFSPKNNKKELMISETDDYETIHVHGGHDYRLQCDPDVVARINLIDLSGE